MRLNRTLVPALLSLALAGCASLNGVSVTPIPAARDHVVKAESEKMIILGLTFDNDFADKVSADLSRQCPNGKVSGILTKDESYFYFLFFVVKHKLSATGYCDEKTGVIGAYAPKSMVNPDGTLKPSKTGAPGKR